MPYFGLPCPATYFLANAAWTRARKFRCYVPLPLPFHSCTLPFSFTQHYLSHSAPTRHLITKINFQMPCHKDFQPIFRLDFLVQHHKSFVYIYNNFEYEEKKIDRNEKNSPCSNWIPTVKYDWKQNQEQEIEFLFKFPIDRHALIGCLNEKK